MSVQAASTGSADLCRCLTIESSTLHTIMNAIRGDPRQTVKLDMKPTTRQQLCMVQITLKGVSWMRAQPMGLVQKQMHSKSDARSNSRHAAVRAAAVDV